MICGIVFWGLFRRINVYESFVEGAKSGLESTFRIVAPLVGLIVGIYMLRASGALDMFASLISPITDFFDIPADVLPLALLRPVSGSGSIAIVNDIFKNCGPDSLAGKIASVMMGSTETTFYTIAVYFGAVGIKSARHTAKAALTADVVGMIMSIVAVRLML
ncbi:MAG: spore maturation protein [Clostridia bacterium]|nr:spore maturation protein [Clostridia bacterium]